MVCHSAVVVMVIFVVVVVMVVAMMVCHSVVVVIFDVVVVMVVAMMVCHSAVVVMVIFVVVVVMVVVVGVSVHNKLNVRKTARVFFQMVLLNKFYCKMRSKVARISLPHFIICTTAPLANFWPCEPLARW